MGPICLAVFAFVAYVTFNRHPGLGLFDASEYSTHIIGNGVAHAPGYPLYILCGKFMMLFTQNPFTAQFLVGLASAALTVGFLVLAFREDAETWDPRAALLAIVLFLSSHFIKLYTILPEVFLLNVAIFAGMAFALVRWFRSDDPRRIFWVFVAYGLGFSHHHTLALTLPAFFALFLLKWRDIQWGKTVLYTALGILAGTLPVWFLFLASSPEADYTYYYVRNFQDLLFVLLRKGYGTFALTVFKESATKAQLYAHVLKGFAKNLNYVGLLALVPLAFPVPGETPVKGFWNRCRARPLLVFSVITLAVYFGLFVPQFNIPLTFEKYKNIVLRFLTVPAILFVYPAYEAFRRLTARGRDPVYFQCALAVLLAANFFSFRDLRFKHYETLDRHIEFGFQVIDQLTPKEPFAQISQRYRKCAIFVRPDALVFGVRFVNEFVAPTRCFFFTLASFSGQFNARHEEALQRMAFGPDYSRLVFENRNAPEKLMSQLFLKLKDAGFRIFLFYPTDSVIFNEVGFRYRPMGNIQELVLENKDPPFPMMSLLEQQQNYLRAMLSLLQRKQGETMPAVVLDESVHFGLFENVHEYMKLTNGQMGVNPALKQLHDEVFARINAMYEIPLASNPSVAVNVPPPPNAPPPAPLPAPPPANTK
jgi:hypothetical protein